MANPFEVSVPKINPLADLMQGYSSATGITDARNTRQARLAARDALLNGGDTQSALARLLGAGDTKDAAVLASMANSQRATSGVYGTPIYGTDANGNTVLGAISRDGQFHQLDTHGITPTPGIKIVKTPQGSYILDSRSGFPRWTAPGIQPPVAQPGAPAPYGQAPTRGQQPGLGVAPVQIPQAGQRAPAPGFIPNDNTGAARDKAYGQGRGKLLAAQPQAIYSLGNATSGLDRMKTAAQGILSDPNLGSATGNVIGQVGAIPFLNTDEVRKIENLKTQIGFSVLQAMRDASKTGGALGQVTEAEHKYLQNAIASLERSQSTPQFKKSLQMIIDYVDGAKQRLASAYQRTYGEAQGAAGDPISAARDAISRGADRNAVIQRLQQNGINPAGL